jgi:hypothetical protein
MLQKLVLLPSWSEGLETHTLLGPLEIANLSQCTSSSQPIHLNVLGFLTGSNPGSIVQIKSD